MKTYNGYELIKALKNRVIPKGTKIYIKKESNQYRFYTIVGKYRQLHIWREEEEKDILLERFVDTEDLINSNFIIYEKENTIDRIKEFIKKDVTTENIKIEGNKLFKIINKDLIDYIKEKIVEGINSYKKEIENIIGDENERL